MRHRSGFVLACVIAACGTAVADSPARAPACAPPVSDDDWPVSTPQAGGFDPAALCSELSKLSAGNLNVHGLLIERHGQLVAELYRAGPDHPISVRYGLNNPWQSSTRFDADTIHDVRSVSKSIVSLVYGIELAKGRAPPPETPVLEVYRDLSPPWSRDASITFQHLLTMSTGLLWHEWGRSALTSDETSLYWRSKTVRFVLDRPVTAAPGRTFNYSSGGTAVLAETLARTSGTPLAELANTDLFGPLGITRFEWTADLHGRALAFSGLRLRPRDMLKIGRLLSSRGVWRGRQVVPQSWIEASTRARIATGVGLVALDGEAVSYGYQWWTARMPWRGRELAWVAAVGNGGQRILAVPDLDLTVVLTGGDYGSPDIQSAESSLLRSLLAALAA